MVDDDFSTRIRELIVEDLRMALAGTRVVADVIQFREEIRVHAFGKHVHVATGIDCLRIRDLQGSCVLVIMAQRAYMHDGRIIGEVRGYVNCSEPSPLALRP